MVSIASSSWASVASGRDGTSRSERADRHRKSASHSRSARSVFSDAAVAVTQPCSPGWCPGSDSACSAAPSSAKGEGAKTMRSGGSPVMSMTLAMCPSCARPGPARLSIDGSRQSTRRQLGGGRRVRDMNASQQHLLDAYRAARRGEEAPVLPGAGTVRAVRDIREWRRFHAVVTDPADRLPARTRRALRAAAAATARLLTGRPAVLPTDPTSPLPTGRPTDLPHTGPHPSAPSNPAAPSNLSAASNPSGDPAPRRIEPLRRSRHPGRTGPRQLTAGRPRAPGSRRERCAPLRSSSALRMTRPSPRSSTPRAGPPRTTSGRASSLSPPPAGVRPR